MVAREIFSDPPPLTLADLADRAGVSLPASANPTGRIRAATALDRAGPTDVTLFAGDGEIDDLRSTRAGACFLAAADLPALPRTTVGLVTDQPRHAFRRVAVLLHPHSLRTGPVFERRGIDPAAIIHGEAHLEPGVIVDPGVVIGPRAEIGTGTVLGAHSVIGAGVKIGRNCAIDAHVSIREALIGDRVVIRAGARIGAPVSGTDRSSRDPLPYLGRVIIQDDVEIGANVVIERGDLDDTMIGEGARIATLTVVAAAESVGRHARRVRGQFSSSEEMV